MKKIVFVTFLSIVSLFVNAQSQLDDFGRIILNTYLPENPALSFEVKNLLKTKLNQISSMNGMGGSDVNPRFIISLNYTIGTKDIIAGPPQMIAQNIELSIFIGDAVSSTIYASTSINLKGVGTNENKALIEAFKTINPKNKEILAFLEEGKKKIISYYATQCDFLIKNAKTLVSQGKFDEAIYQLSIVPEVCQDCYFKCLDTLSSIYQLKIDTDGELKLKQAKIIWASAQNSSGAEKAGDILSTINAFASCMTEVNVFIKSIDNKLKEDEKARWQFKMKQYEDKIAMKKEEVRLAAEKSKRDDTFRENQAQRDAIYREKQSQRNFELDKVKANAYREIAVEYARNQPKQVTNNNIVWRRY